MKATVLLALTLFLVSAPAPDSATIAEFSAQFIVLDAENALQAAEESPQIEDSTAVPGHSAPRTAAPRSGTAER